MPFIQHLSGWIYWIAFLAALVETVLVVGLFLPGSTLLLLLGALSAGGGGPSFLWLLIFAVVGATLGDNVNYMLGRRYGRRWTENGLWLLRREHLEKAHVFFSRHGGKSIFFSRFIPSLKEVAPFVAGTAGMSRGWFFIWNLLGALGWGLQWVGGGYMFARSLTLAQQWMSRAGLGAALLAISVLLFWYLRRWMLRNGPEWWVAVVSVSHTLAQTIRENPEVKAQVRAHPRLFGFLGARLNRQHFSGLPLTLFGVAFLYLLLLFGGLVEDLIMSDPIVALDHSVAEVMVALRTPAWVTAATWVSSIGVWQVVLAILLVSCIWLWLSRRRFYILPLLISASGSTLFAFAGKLALHRARPLEAAMHEASYAFPSGHALISVSLFGFLAYIWLREISNWPMRVNIFFAWVLLALSIGLSRIVLGVHFLSDVLGGYLLGGLWLLVAIVWAEWTRTGTARMETRSMPFVLPLALAFVGAVYLGVLLAPARTPPVPISTASISQLLPLEADSFLAAHLPHYVRGTLGARVQPLSVALLVGDEIGLRKALRIDGWTPASPIGGSALLKLTREGLKDLQAPSVPLFWNNELYTLAYNRYTQTSKQTQMMSLLLWQTPYRNAAGETLWVGIVRAYSGMHWYPARRLSPDLDAAREQALAGLRERGCLASTKHLSWVAPQVGQTFTEDDFFTRGDLVFLRFDPRCLDKVVTTKIRKWASLNLTGTQLRSVDFPLTEYRFTPSEGFSAKADVCSGVPLCPLRPNS